MYELEFSNSAKKFLKRCDQQLANRLVQRTEKLIIDPFPSDVKRVVNREEKVFRIRVGDYRIQYQVIHDQNFIFVSDIDKRERAY